MGDAQLDFSRLYCCSNFPNIFYKYYLLQWLTNSSAMKSNIEIWNKLLQKSGGGMALLPPSPLYLCPCKKEKKAISERISTHCRPCTAGFSQTYLMENLSLKVCWDMSAFWQIFYFGEQIGPLNGCLTKWPIKWVFGWNSFVPIKRHFLKLSCQNFLSISVWYFLMSSSPNFLQKTRLFLRFPRKYRSDKNSGLISSLTI